MAALICTLNNSTTSSCTAALYVAKPRGATCALIMCESVNLPVNLSVLDACVMSVTLNLPCCAVAGCVAGAARGRVRADVRRLPALRPGAGDRGGGRGVRPAVWAELRRAGALHSRFHLG